MRSLWMVLLAAHLVAGAGFAQDRTDADKGEGLMGWLKSLQRKIESLAPQRSLQLSTGVAGIRGAKDDEQAKLYWKGKDTADPVTVDELSAFGAAVDLALTGKQAEAAKELEKFIAQYPDSPLIADARKTLEMVKNEAQ